MAEILAVTDGPAGMRFSTIELCRRLVAAGHAVIFAGAASARELAEHHGLGYRELEPNGLGAFHNEDSTAGVVDRLRRIPERRRTAAASTGASRFAALLDELGPDLVLLDGEMHEHIVVGAGAGVQLALLNTFCSIWRRPGLPPPHTPIRPGVGWRGNRLGMALAWTAFDLRKRIRSLRHRIGRVGCDRVSVLRSIARDAGFDLDREADPSQWLIPFTYPRLPALSLHAFEFEFHHEPAPGVRFVGPMVLEERLDPPMPEADRRRLDAVLDRRRGSGSEGALLYAGFGSFFTADRRWLCRLIDAVGKRPDRELVLALGDGLDPAELGGLPEGVYAFAWVPQLEVLSHADAAIVHGGINTIDECVLAGVPMLVVCGGETDMAGNTARVLHHGLGLAADPVGDGAVHILGRLDRLLGDAAIKENLDRMGLAYRTYAENGEVERVVDDLLGGRRGAPP
ncbi:MAG: nucleotide disphospho-sugar-binding domain-containing protein [Thermoanaerobaculales bacterium]|nr:nucleotide disphospho-sugar-binding domain-containing protein [Thermoanaerobaculales bacterium]